MEGKEGLSDASKFNSVFIVQKDFIDSLKVLTGENNDLQVNVVAGKPIITFANDGTAAFLGKTMFMVDARFEDYMRENDINAVGFSSAVKLMGSDYHDTAIDITKFANMNELLAYRDPGKAVALPLESIEMQSWVQTDHDARIPMHMGADLVGESLNKSYFNWLMDGPVRNYEQSLGGTIGGGNINQMIARARNLIGELGDEIDNDTYSSMSRWLGANGYPLFLPFRNSINNAMFRSHIEDAGTFSPMNSMGSQSVLVPSYYSFGESNYLRSTTFYTPKDGNKRVYTYGQIEAGTNNRSKSINKNRASVIIHRDGRPDELLEWKEFIQFAETVGAKDLFGSENTRTLDDVFNYINGINEKLPEGAKAEVAMVVTRVPSTRSSDKVIVGLKGFIEGNYGRLNSLDTLTKLEGDYDIDKVNYWWDTPYDILKEWDSKLGNILSVKADAPSTSIDGLDLNNKRSLLKYNFDNQVAAKYRGIAMKARRMVQWMEHYQGFHEFSEAEKIKGYNLGWVDGATEHRIRIDDTQLAEVKGTITEDIQRIVDSKDGFPEDIYTSDWFKNRVTGPRGIFKYETRRVGDQQWQPHDELQPIHRDIIDLSLQPYRNLLQLSTDVYVDGEAKRVDYQSFMSGYESYRDVMNRLGPYVMKGLRRRGFKPDVYGSIFFQDGRLRDIFGLHNARMPAPLKKDTKADYGKGDALLPFDRGVWATASLDRLSIEEPTRTHRLAEENFESIWDKYIDKDGMENAVITEVTRSIKKDVQNIDFLNVIDRKLRRARSGLRRAGRYKDESLQSFLQERVNRLERVRNSVNDNILSDTNARSAIAKTIRRQLVRALHKGNDVKLASVDREGKVSYNARTGRITGRSDVNLRSILGKKFRSENARNAWIEENWTRINATLWSRDDLAVEIKGISSNEYAQVVMWHRTLASKTGFMLDPRQFTYAHDFEYAVREFRRSVSNYWRKFKVHEEFAANEREDVVSATIMRNLEGEYRKWEDMHPGLGNLFILKMMTPESAGGVVTYHNGEFLVGFKNIRKEIKYIGLGLRFLSRTEQIPEMPGHVIRSSRVGLGDDAPELFTGAKDAMFQDLAETFTNGMRVLYNQEPVLRENIDITRNQVGGIDAEGFIKESLSDLNINDAINHASEVFKTIEKGDLNDIAKISSDVRSLYGVTGDIALDYLSLKGAPVGLDKLFDIRRMADFYFKPRAVLNNQGRLRNVSNLSSYYGFVRNNAKVYFGDLSEGNILRSDVSRKDVNDFGGSFDRRVETAEDMKQIVKDKQTTIRC